MRTLKELKRLIPEKDLNEIIIIIGKLKDDLDGLVAEAKKKDIHITKEEAAEIVSYIIKARLTNPEALKPESNSVYVDC